jgi:hypothetical protein
MKTVVGRSWRQVSRLTFAKGFGRGILVVEVVCRGFGRLRLEKKNGVCGRVEREADLVWIR